MSRGIPNSTPGHGTVARYVAGCHCTPCTTAKTRYSKRRSLDALNGTRRRVDATGTRRRIRALAAIGWSSTALADRLAVTSNRVRQLTHLHTTVEISTGRRVEALYNTLSMTLGPSDITRRHALAAGWAPPLAWDDATINDPNATPRGAGRPRTDDTPDVVAIARAIDGHHIPLNDTERLEVIRALAARGLSDEAIAARVDRTARTVLRIRNTHRIPSTWSAAA